MELLDNKVTEEDKVLFSRIKQAIETGSTLDEVNYYYDEYLPSIQDEYMEKYYKELEEYYSDTTCLG